MAAAAALWAEAVRVGPRFATPRLFPRALPSHLATDLAGALEIRGAAVTLVGSGDAVFADARNHVRERKVDRALIARIADHRAEIACIRSESS